MSINTSFGWRCQVCGRTATVQINGAEWYCAYCAPKGPLYATPNTVALTREVEGLRSENAALRAQVEALRGEKEELEGGQILNRFAIKRLQAQVEALTKKLADVSDIVRSLEDGAAFTVEGMPIGGLQEFARIVKRELRVMAAALKEGTDA